MENSEKTVYPIVGVAFSESYKGLTKREYFAGLAMQGILANKSSIILDLNDADKVYYALVMVDELLKQLEK